MNNQILLLPIIFPLAGAMAALLLGRWSRYQGSLSLLMMVGGLVTSLAVLLNVWSDGQAMTLQLGGGQLPMALPW